MNITCPLYTGTVTKVRAKIKQYTGINHQKRLLEYIDADSKKRILNNDQIGGIVTKIHVKVNDKLEKGKLLFDLIECPHDVEVMGLCAACGIDMAEYRLEQKKLKEANKFKTSQNIMQ